MRYHRTDLGFAETIVFCRAPLSVQGALHWLWIACCREESAGTIHSAKTFTDADWRALTCGQLTRKRVLQVVDAKLAHWNGDHLEVQGYDTAGQQAYQAQRARMQDLRQNRSGASTAAAPCANGAGRREGKGMEGERREPTPSPSSDARPPGGDGERRRLDRADWGQVRAAIAAGDPLALVAGFYVEIGTEHTPGWLREAGGLDLYTLAVVLAWRAGTRNPVRLPSGLRGARAEWRALSPDERTTTANRYADLLGAAPASEPR